MDGLNDDCHVGSRGRERLKLMQREAECERARGADPLRYLLDVLVDLATLRDRLQIDAECLARHWSGRQT
jgi:hypothetical protein